MSDPIFLASMSDELLKSILCPETGRRPTVELIAHIGEMKFDRDEGAGWLQQNEREVTCRKSCLTSATVLEAPYISARKL